MEDQSPRNRDHDLLTRIDANLSNFLARFEDHTRSDEISFSDLKQRSQKLERFMWLLTGALVILEAIFKLMTR